MNLTNELPVHSKSRVLQRSRPVVWRWPGARSAHVLLYTAAIAVAALLILVPAYLLMRMAGAGWETFDLMVKANTLQTLLNTVLLAGSVTFAAVVIAIPVAWLTVCTDLRGKRIWAILAACALSFSWHCG